MKAIFFLCKISKKEGNGFLTFIVLVTLTAVLALSIIPPLNSALKSNVEKNIKVYKTNDTTGIK